MIGQSAVSARCYVGFCGNRRESTSRPTDVLECKWGSMTTVDISTQHAESAGSPAAGPSPGTGLAPLVDSAKLVSDPRDTAVVRASHRIYEHLIAMFAPGMIEAAFDLGVFTALADGPATVADLAGRLDADAQGLRMLLDGLYCYEIVHRKAGDGDGGLYWLVEGMAECLLPDGLYSLAGRIGYDRTIGWDAWRDFARHVRRPAVDEGGEYQANQLSTEDYESVAKGINFWAPPIVEALTAVLTERGWTAEGPRSMVDVGCGTGIYSQLLLQRFDGLCAVGLDAERMVLIAMDQAAQLDVGDRFMTRVQDFFVGDWEPGHDLVLLVNIIHLQTAAGAQELLGKAAEAVGEDGVVAIVDQIVDDRCEPQSIQNRFFRLFAASMLVTGGGDSYSLAEYDGWLDRAGLRRVALVDTPMHRILLAQRA
jgi:SAM-dependent methyltransferase